jgi:hypothetical protein
MIESLLHFFGFCPDHFSHVNMIDAPWQDILNFFNQIKSIFRK